MQKLNRKRGRRSDGTLTSVLRLIVDKERSKVVLTISYPIGSKQKSSLSCMESQSLDRADKELSGLENNSAQQVLQRRINLEAIYDGSFRNTDSPHTASQDSTSMSD